MIEFQKEAHGTRVIVAGIHHAANMPDRVAFSLTIGAEGKLYAVITTISRSALLDYLDRRLESIVTENVAIMPVPAGVNLDKRPHPKTLGGIKVIVAGFYQPPEMPDTPVLMFTIDARGAWYGLLSPMDKAQLRDCLDRSIDMAITENVGIVPVTRAAHCEN